MSLSIGHYKFPSEVRMTTTSWLLNFPDLVVHSLENFRSNKTSVCCQEVCLPDIPTLAVVCPGIDQTTSCRTECLPRRCHNPCSHLSPIITTITTTTSLDIHKMEDYLKTTNKCLTRALNFCTLRLSFNTKLSTTF